MPIEPQLTKAELAALDYLIADMEEVGEPRAFVRQLVRQALREGVREAVRQVVRRAFGGMERSFGGADISDEELKARAAKELSASGSALDDLIRIRNLLAKE